MLEEFSTRNDKFSYTKLTEEEISSRGILGRLVGPIADTRNPTRNGRKYNKKLWENVFNDPIMQEKIKNRCLFLELGHPADRTETDMEKVCACMAEQPKVGDDGLLYGVVDILPTANGKILKALCDYGTTVGISSRGTGDVIEDDDGSEAVDPDTYECETFDIVLIPAVESARLQYVTESVDANKLKLRKALSESLSKATEEERKVMTETLDNLNIKIDEEKREGASGDETIPTEKKTSPMVEEIRKFSADEEESVPEKGGYISEESETGKESSEEAKDDGSEEIIKSLQETLKEKASLEVAVKTLQEQLAVANGKVSMVGEELGKLKSSLAELDAKQSKNDEYITKVSALEEELKAKNKTIDGLKSRISSLVESKKSDAVGAKSLNESIVKKDLEIKSLNDNFDEIKSDYERKIASLNEELQAVKSASESKGKEDCEAIDRERKLKENYKKIATAVVNRYIESKATVLGVKEDEIKNRLPESYTIDDIDSICEDLQSYELNISKLPFNVDRKVKVKVRESANEPLNPGRKAADDDVDESLLRLAGLAK